MAIGLKVRVRIDEVLAREPRGTLGAQFNLEAVGPAQARDARLRAERMILNKSYAGEQTS